MGGLSTDGLTAQLPGGFEWIIILIIIAVLLLFGPQKLPELARGIGKALGEFRRGKMEVERQISTELSEMDARDLRNRIEKAASALKISTAGKSEMQMKLDIAPPNFESNYIARLVLAELRDELLRLNDDDAVELDEDVIFLEADFRRRSVGQHLCDDGMAVALLQ